MKRAAPLLLFVAAAALAWWLLQDPPQRFSPPATGESSQAAGVAEDGVSGPGLDARGTSPPRQASSACRPDAGAVVAAGRVVDQDRRPVAGAEVLATMEGLPADRARSDAAGRFELTLGPRSNERRHGLVEVRRAAEGAARALYVSPDTPARLDIGTLVLEPFPPGFDWGHVVTDDGLWASWRAPHEKDEGEAVNG